MALITFFLQFLFDIPLKNYEQKENLRYKNVRIFTFSVNKFVISFIFDSWNFFDLINFKKLGTTLIDWELSYSDIILSNSIGYFVCFIFIKIFDLNNKIIVKSINNLPYI